MWGLGASFVVADIPGLIEGAADGAGLGIQFLKHLQRTRLLLHIVDISDLAQLPPEAAIQSVVGELRAFDVELASRPRWLVFNKADTLPADQAQLICEQSLRTLAWNAPWFLISGVSGQGCKALCQKIWVTLGEDDDALD